MTIHGEPLKIALMKAVYATLFFVSAAILAFQVTLTRFFSLTQGHHFAFMAISLALLGAGASGTYLSIRPPPEARWQRLLRNGSLLFTLSLPASYLFFNYLPYDAYRLAWEPVQLWWLSLYYLTLTVPFFFGGLVIGTALSSQAERAGPLYAANLLGAGVGSPLALLTLANAGGPSAVFCCTLLGWLAAVSSQLLASRGQKSVPNWGPLQPTLPGLLYIKARYQRAKPGIQIAGYLLITGALVYLILNPPALFDLRLTPYKSLSQGLLYPGSEVIFSQWNAVSRVDVLQSQGIRSAPGLSFTYPGELPPQLGLLIDGDNLSPITHPTQPTFVRYLPLSLAFVLRPDADVLILEPGGGLAVLTALQHGVRSVTVVQSNPTAVEVVRDHFADFSGSLYDDPRLTIVVDEPRSFLGRTHRQFDLILLPLTDSFRPVTAGAYTLGEDYRYTVEALAKLMTHLSPEGLVVAERWLQLPPSESLRLWGTMIEALRRTEADLDLGPPARHLAALRSLQTSLIIAARAPLAASEISQVRALASRLQFDLIWLPDIRPEETNRFSLVPNDPYYQTFAGLLASSNPADFYATYPYAVTPPTDDHPFFFHFFKWRQTPEILQSLGKSWQPFGGSGYLVLVLLLGLVIILSVLLILLPLLWTRRRRSDSHPPVARRSVAYLLYFSLLGLGFLFVEIPVLQRFILYLGQPATSFTVVVSALLIAAGIGSGYLAKRLSLLIVLPLIALLMVVYPLLLPSLFEATLRFPFAGRIVVTVLALLPLGVLLGVPFPAGLTLVAKGSPGLVPWVWAVNGCASVISAVLAPMVALTWGFSAVLLGAALAYGSAGLVVWVWLAGERHKAHPAPVAT